MTKLKCPRICHRAASNIDDVRPSASRRLAAVGFQEAAKPFLTSNRPQRNDVRFGNVRPAEDGLVAERLMRSIFVVMTGKLGAEMIEVFGSENDEVIESLAAEALDKSFNERVQVGRTEAILPGDDSIPLQRFHEALGELPVTVILHRPYFQSPFTSMFHERTRVFDDPRFVGVQCGRRDHDLPRFDVDEHEHEGVADAGQRHDLLREEVALPERNGVPADEVVPGSRAAFRSGVEPMLLEYPLDGVPRDPSHPELFEFAEDAGITPGILGGEFHDQPPHVDRLPLAAPFPRNLAVAILPNPPQDRAWRNDGRQGMDGLADLRCETDQSPLLGRCHRDSLRQPCPQNLVLDLKVLDLPGKLLVGG
jgi:hypothetical protein